MTRFFFRFVGWWAAIGSLAAMGGACPCCNSVVCPQGMAVWGVMGAICACIMRGKPQNTQDSPPEEPRFARHDFAFNSPLTQPTSPTT